MPGAGTLGTAHDWKGDSETVEMERTSMTSLTLPSPDGVAVNQPAGVVPIRLRRRTLSNVEPVSVT